MGGERRVTLEFTIEQLWLINWAASLYQHTKWNEIRQLDNTMFAVFKEEPFPDAVYAQRSKLVKFADEVERIQDIVMEKIIEDEKKDEDDNTD
jgi:hypothetical protein